MVVQWDQTFYSGAGTVGRSGAVGSGDERSTDVGGIKSKVRTVEREFCVYWNYVRRSLISVIYGGSQRTTII